MDLSTLTILLGIATMLPALYGLIKPSKLAAFVRGLSRNTVAGYVFVALGTAWFLFVLENETLADFEIYRSKMRFFFVLLGIGACVYLKDFLAVRGLAVVMLLLAKTVIEAARFEDTSWRLILICFAYIWIICGMIFTVSPWRFRDAMEWKFANADRIRMVCYFRLLIGLLLLGLGMTVFRTSAIAGQ
jgi:hypothetical protein